MLLFLDLDFSCVWLLCVIAMLLVCLFKFVVWRVGDLVVGSVGVYAADVV